MRCFIGFCCAMTFVGVAKADVAQDFEACVRRLGPAYVAARDAVLADAAAGPFIQSKSDSDDWNIRVTATILLGWIENKDKYRELIDSPQTVDLAGHKRYPWASKAENMDVSLLPLAVEFVCKNSAGEAGRSAAVRMVPFLSRRVPEPAKSVRFLVPLIRDERTPAEIRLSAAGIVERLPNEMVDSESVTGLLRAESGRGDSHQAVAGQLANALISRSGSLDAGSREAVVSMLLDDSIVANRLGNRAVVHTIGSIGSNRALPTLQAFFNQSKSEADSVWAITSIGRIGTPESLTVIENVLAKDGELSDAVKAGMFRGVGSGSHSTKAVGILQKGLERESSSNVKIEALRSIESLYRKSNDVNANRQLLKFLRDFEAKESGDQKLKAELQGVFNRLD
jgi:HEAT repeat protein